MPKQTLKELAKANKPLVEVGIALADWVDSDKVLSELNELADDFEATYSVYRWITGDKHLLTAEATPEALHRLFGWEIKRVNLERWHPESQKYEGVWENTYRWEPLNKPTKYPPCLEGNVIELTLNQPGTNDDGSPIHSPDQGLLQKALSKW